jgi:hypothetical protein
MPPIVVIGGFSRKFGISEFSHPLSFNKLPFFKNVLDGGFVLERGSPSKYENWYSSSNNPFCLKSFSGD